MGKYIDADTIHWHDDGWACIRKDEYPTIDAVSVVRCKECWHGTDMKNGKEFCIRCDIMDDLLMLADGYCNFGERKESE